MSANQPRILLVEDDANFGDVLRSYLEMHDYHVTLAEDGQEGLDTFNTGRFDLCIFDVMMPKKDGFMLAQDIRQQDRHTPIIFLTARTLKDDVLQGFKIGADDYITKPFNSEELLMRIQAVLRRSTVAPVLRENGQREFHIGRHYHFDYPLRVLYFDGEEDTKLSPKEAQLLRLFCLYQNDILPRSEALNQIWNEDNYFTARSMDVFVTKLRKYLRRDENVEIVNIHGNGFQLLVREE